MTPRRAPLALLVALLLGPLLALGPGTAAPAAAHASLVATDPADGAVLASAPAQLTFTFDEAVRTGPDAVRLYDAAGRPVSLTVTAEGDLLTARPDATLAEGSYVAVYRAASSDGHPIAGTVTFAVGAPSERVVAPPPVQVESAQVRTALGVVQGVGYLGLLAAAGLLVFLAVGLQGLRVDDALRTRLGLAAGWAAGIALLAGVIGLPLQGAYQLGLPATALGERAAVDPAVIGEHLLVLGLIACGLAGALYALRRGAGRTWVAGPALVAAFAPALVGHSRAIEPVWLVVLTDLGHLAAGTVWFGGLLGLVLTLGALAGRPRDAAAVLTRFSAAAATALGTVAVTGTLMAWRILETPSALLDTAYGRVLLGKVALVGVVAAVAGWNHTRLLPGVVDGVGHRDRQAAAHRVARSVRVEAGVLVSVLLVAGVLTTLSPRPAERTALVAAPAVTRVDTPDARVLAGVATDSGGEGGVAGPRLLLRLQDPTGAPLAPVAPPEVRVRAGDLDLGVVTLRQTGVGAYLALTTFPRPGRWDVRVRFFLPDAAPDVRLQVVVP